MQKAFEKLIERLEEKANQTWLVLAERNGYKRAIEIVSQVAEEYKAEKLSMKDAFMALKLKLVEESEDDYVHLGSALGAVDEVAKQFGNSEQVNDGWIPVSSGKLPEVEKEVFIQTKRGYITTAMYEDGTMYSDDSIWHWYDCDFEWDDEKEDYIISQGWWEYRHFNPDDVYNNIVDDEVIAWQPLPEPYQPKG